MLRRTTLIRFARYRWRAVGAGLALAVGVPLIHADTKKPPSESNKSLRELFRSYFVFSMCSMPALVDASPTALSVLSSIPLVKQLTEAFVRVTFFDQFVGADTAEAALPLLRTLRQSNKGALFAYSVEVDESEATASSSSKSHGPPPYKRIVNEMVHCIDVAADFEDAHVGNSSTGRRTWVAIKMTALLPDAQALLNLSSHIISTRSANSIPFPGCPRSSDLDVIYNSASSQLSAQDAASLRELHQDLIRICTRAKERGVKIIIDAEYSWYQPAIDALQLALMRQFNDLSSSKGRVQPLIYGTYQAYLRRTPAHLKQSLIDARQNNFALGVKLVRGAYHPHELDAYHARASGKPSLCISPDEHPPVWINKSETDECYNACAKMLIGAIREDIPTSSWSWVRNSKQHKQSIGVLFGTHNWRSCHLILDELVRYRLATVSGSSEEERVFNLGDDVTERLTVAQLYGMSDSLTDHLVQTTRSSSPMIIKYVPYGALSEVMPYLSRRAIENKSILGSGAATEERKHAGAEIWRRVFG